LDHRELDGLVEQGPELAEVGDREQDGDGLADRAAAGHGWLLVHDVDGLPLGARRSLLVEGRKPLVQVGTDQVAHVLSLGRELPDLDELADAAS
jgi:hypothetical protein